ncbi:MAG: hypothetical protein V1689_02065 [Pseudomonadota bacterium]
MILLKPNHSVGCLIVGLGLILFQCCSFVYVTPSPSVLDQKKVSEIVASLRKQEGRVYTLFSSGSLMIKDKGSETESDILVAGIRDPLTIKVEITHPWGRPLLDILIQDSSIHILSFQDKRVYHGSLGGFATSRFFPVGLDPDQIWSFLRGCPILREYDHAISVKTNSITFLSKEEEVVQVMEVFSGSNFPRSISFPGRGIETLYSDYEDHGGIFYARTIRLDDSKNDAMVELSLKRMVFNEPIPDAIFKQEVPPGFEAVLLK